MKRLIHPNRVPYGGGYSLNRPELGMVGSASTFKGLEISVRLWRKANGVPVGLGFSQELVDAVCAEYPNECGDNNPNLPPNKPRRLTLADVIAGTKLMVSFWTKGKPVVYPDEAARRAKICSNCKFNTVVPLPCGGKCGELKNIVTALVGNQTTPYNDQLKSCSLCGCYLTASVWVDLELQWKVLSQEQQNQFRAVPWCWKQLPQ